MYLRAIVQGFLAFTDSQRVTLVVLLDQSVAFDTVVHDVLLNRLSTSFGVRGSALRCFASYLPNRSQPVSFDQKLSENFQLDCGVPQGSCLCPLLFMIYATGDLRSLKSASPKPTHMRVTPNCIFLSRLTRHPHRSMQLIPYSIVWMQLDLDEQGKTLFERL